LARSSTLAGRGDWTSRSMSSATSQMLMFIAAWDTLLMESEDDDLTGVSVPAEDDPIVTGRVDVTGVAGRTGRAVPRAPTPRRRRTGSLGSRMPPLPGVAPAGGSSSPRW
jgi:hypothetical protein